MWRYLAPAAFVISTPALAQSADDALSARASEVAAVMQGARPADQVFGERFLAAIPASQLAAIAAQLQAQGGAITGADEVRRTGPGAASFVLRLEKASGTALLQLEPAPPYKVIGFRITGLTPTGESPAMMLEDFAALPGHAGFALYRLGQSGVQPVLTLHPDEQFAIGSTFKLWVLDAVAEEVAAGRLKWDQVVRLGLPSLPSGMTQDWPAGAPVTVETLATLMISISDNTATDTLIGLIGRDRLAERVRATGHSAPDRMLPFLTTTEAFALKLGPPAVREIYAGADDSGQAKVLSQIDPWEILPSADAARLNGKPTAIDSVEWFASPADIANVFQSLRQRSDPRVMAILGVAPGMTPQLRQSFAAVAYKGGSETGVLNLSWLVQRKDGEWLVATASWNDPAAPLDQARLEMLAQRLLAMAGQ